MLLAVGSRISLHLRDSDLHSHFRCRFRYCTTQISYLSFPSTRSPCYMSCFDDQTKLSSCYSTLPSDSSPEIPPPFDSFSQQEDDQEIISDGLSPIAGGVVALGKFDALHIGHRELAIQASKSGPPFLLSFSGMAKVLGWEQRAPIVAKCDRKRVLSSWASYCCNVVPQEFQVEFSRVRHLSPREFVEKLSNELRVCGVVAGENYRFGYKAAGDASELVKLCDEYGIEAYIIKSVMDKNQYSANLNSNNPKEKGQVSSTRVRQALAAGDMRYVSELLGRLHRLILMATDSEGFIVSNYKVSASKSCLMNLAPKEGLYEKCYLFLEQENVVQCRVVIDTKFVHVEISDTSMSDNFCKHFHILQIEFSGSSS